MKLENLKETEALEVLNKCQALKDKYNADGLKIYFKNESDATIKVIAEGAVIRTIRVGDDSNWDARKKVTLR